MPSVIAAPILALVGIFLVIGARQLRVPGGVRLVAGVKDPGTLKTPQALTSWVGNLLLILASIVSCAAVALLFVPERYYSLVFIPLVVMVIITVAVGAAGVKSRGGTKSC
jgi:hypothetical protein